MNEQARKGFFRKAFLAVWAMLTLILLFSLVLLVDEMLTRIFFDDAPESFGLFFGDAFEDFGLHELPEPVLNVVGTAQVDCEEVWESQGEHLVGDPFVVKISAVGADKTIVNKKVQPFFWIRAVLVEFLRIEGERHELGHCGDDLCSGHSRYRG